MSATGGGLVMSDSNLYITRWGTSGPSIVLVHGSAQGGSAGGDRHFSAQKRLGDRGFQVIVPDRPGHGRSPAPGRPDDAAADAKCVLPLLGEGAHLVGHSFGACVALAAAAMKPGVVRSLTLIEPAMPKIALSNPHVRKFGLRLMMATLLSFSAAQRAQRFSKIVGIPESMRTMPGSEEAERVGRGLKALRLPSKEELMRWLDVITGAKIPLVVVTGGWNPAYEALSDVVAAAGRGSRKVIRSPHHFPQNISDEFNLMLESIVMAADMKEASAISAQVV